MLAHCLALGLLAEAQQGFEPRYELGQRVANLERAFLLAAEDVPKRAGLIDAAELAVERFFRFDYRGAAEALDVVAPEDQLGGWVLAPSRRLYSSSAARLELLLGRWYGAASSADEPPPSIVAQGDPVWSATPLDPDQESGLMRVRWERAFAAQEYGDFELRLELSGDRSRQATKRLWFSRVRDLEGRLTALEAALDAWPAPQLALEQATLRDTLELLRDLAAGPAGETDFPAARLLAEAEEQVLAARSGKAWFGPSQRGQYWLTMPGRGRGTRLRLEVPADGDLTSPRPLVLALHGAGGSENMWFDAYGDGLITRLCQQRGWYLAAPRLGLLGGGDLEGLAARLAERYPIDLARVFVIGHSMGAARALRLAQAQPTEAAALVLLGGGQPIKQAERLQAVPIFLAAGRRDFALPGTEALRDQLLAVEHSDLHFEVTPDVEHLLVVTAVLSRAFEWLDAGLAESALEAR
jgi:hypothetical protein